MCKKTRRLRGKMAEICRHDSALLKEIINGINLGFRECEFQFRNRRWNCTTLRKSMRKILMRGKNSILSLNISFVFIFILIIIITIFIWFFVDVLSAKTETEAQGKERVNIWGKNK